MSASELTVPLYKLSLYIGCSASFLDSLAYPLCDEPGYFVLVIESLSLTQVYYIPYLYLLSTLNTLTLEPKTLYHYHKLSSLGLTSNTLTMALTHPMPHFSIQISASYATRLKS